MNTETQTAGLKYLEQQKLNGVKYVLAGLTMEVVNEKTTFFILNNEVKIRNWEGGDVLKTLMSKAVPGDKPNGFVILKLDEISQSLKVEPSSIQQKMTKLRGVLKPHKLTISFSVAPENNTITMRWKNSSY